MTTILSLDPSAERTISDTGYCYGEFDDNKPFRLLDSGVVRGGFNGFVSRLNETQDGLDTLYNRILSADIVVCEQFISWEPRADSTPRLIEGVVRYLRPDAVLQPSSGYKTAVSDDVLKQLGLWTTEGHHADSRSATRHLIMYLKNNLHRPTLEAGWING